VEEGQLADEILREVVEVFAWFELVLGYGGGEEEFWGSLDGWMGGWMG
jgi:hypothetical protein